MKIKFLKKVLLILSFFISVFNCQLAIAQNYSTTSKKAINSFEEAIGYLNKKNYADAEKELKKAIDKDENFAEAYLLLGDVYSYEKKTENAIESYKKGLELSPGKNTDMYYALANAEFSVARYDEAKKHYQYYIQSNISNNDNLDKAKKNIDNCNFAINAIKNPVPFKPKNLGKGVNSKYEEYFPCVTVDGKTLLYTRLTENAASSYGNGFNEDLYVSYLKDSVWSTGESIGAPINTIFNEGAACISPDGQLLIYTICDDISEGRYGNDRNGYGSCDLFFSRKTGNSWSNPINIGPPINTRMRERLPSYSSDGKTIYFVRSLPGQKGIKNQVIYMSELGNDGKWKEPVKLSSKINKPGSRIESVFIHPDNKTLYFSSDALTGMGGLDMFLSRRDEKGEWSEPQNLGYPINTIDDEWGFTVSGDGRTAFFSSDRKGGFGGMDIYSFSLPEQDKPLEVSYMKGKIFDKETKNPLYARFELIDIETGKLVVKSYSNKGNGEFLISLPVNKNYALNVSADKYLFYSENFQFSNKGTIVNPVLKDIPLQPIKVGETVVLRNIFFETAKYDLKSESEIELNKLIDFLTKNPKIKIEISGHTDNVGAEDYNKTLSENRAKAVYEYLTAHNIAADRMTYKGFGDSKPIDTNDTEQGRANNRRTEFKVISN